MRLDLHLQSLQLRLGQLGRESCRPCFSLTKSAVVVDRRGNDQSGSVDRQALLEVIGAKSVVAPEYGKGGVACRVYVAEIPD